MLTPDEIKIFSLCAQHLPASPIVFDVGAYKGDYSSMVQSRFQFSNCYLFEPNDELYTELCKKFGENNVANILISHSKGRQSFFRCLDKADELSSAYRREIFAEVENIEESKPCI